MKFKRKLTACLFIFVLAIFSFGQSSENKEKTRIYDEFLIIPHCDFSKQIDLLLIELMNNPKLKAHILLYRGTKDLLANQSDRYFSNRKRLIEQHVKLRNFPIKRIVIVDAGFWETDTLIHRLWIVPEGGEIPTPKNVVPKPQISTEKAYLADRSWLDLNEQTFEYLDEKVKRENDLLVDNYLVEDNEYDSELIEEDIYLFSEFFIDELKKNKTSKGIIFYFADTEEYRLGKVEEILKKDLKRYTKKHKIDINKINLIYGGYRKEPKLEFWIVPKNAPDAIPTPEQKKIK